MGSTTVRVTVRNARFQQWQSLLTNRNARHRHRQFLVHGVRPISLAAEHGWQFAALLYPGGRRLSRWADDQLSQAGGDLVEMAPELLDELSGREETPELIAVVTMPEDDIEQIRVDGGPVVVFDRPGSPGNLGTLIRSADAFGAGGVVVTGHAADVYDPATVRASTGSIFSMPSVRVDAPTRVAGWLAGLRESGSPVRLIGTDESATVELADADLTGPLVIVVGNETTGMSAAWRDACDEVVRIPIGGAASSLNAAVAGSIVLYQSHLQRRAP
ncbi:TrmH family RNA methyltransferase [Allocatelliglobosispora scoriae]|uniref:TrmH family RNA methyltransferase n=1 Tax=Allocatelliglobosispora scoriae TaxID=643052 RepID=A0A841BK58_9ACTN|nr:TrmH family RNA methyltransferase [Allocatelliglobosispora scoriae]MBB5868654.1 TrmH family RNA methyltransferase [Allocatelliglobosispora scoriae]